MGQFAALVCSLGVMLLALMAVVAKSSEDDGGRGDSTVGRRPKPRASWNPDDGSEAPSAAEPTSEEKKEKPTRHKERPTWMGGASGVDIAQREADLKEFNEAKAVGSAGGKSQGEKPKMDKCLKDAVRFCSLSLLHDNFAGFIECLTQSIDKLRPDCQDWGRYHLGCVADVKKFCSGQDPPRTTECLFSKYSDLTDECKESQFFKSLADGFHHFQRAKERHQGKPAQDFRDKSHEDFDEL